MKFWITLYLLYLKSMGNYHAICMDINVYFFPFWNYIFVSSIENLSIFMSFLVLSAHNPRDSGTIVSSTS